MTQSKKIAVTGGIGSGKSYICGLIAKRGYPVFSCDEINRALWSDEAYCKELADRFPACTVGGEIDKTLRGKFKTSCLFTRKTCDTCFAKFICSGGCSANNYHYNGDIDVPYGITCAMMKKRIECAMHILAEKKKGI